jgi:uncharacterized protein (DUF1499 family)
LLGKILFGIGILVAVAAAGIAVHLMVAKGDTMFAGKRPDNLGVTNGRLIPCKRSPNCVSSQAERGDREHYIEPIKFHGDAITALRKLLHAMERVTVVREAPNYLYAEFKSRLMGYVDDVEFLYEPGPGLIQVRSASRLGRRDFGVNRQRIEQIRGLMQESR